MKDDIKIDPYNVDFAEIQARAHRMRSEAIAYGVSYAWKAVSTRVRGLFRAAAIFKDSAPAN